MENEKSKKLAAVLLVMMAIVVGLAVTIIVISTRQDNAAEAETKAMTELVEAHHDTAFANKWLDDEELVDRDEHYIRQRLSDMLKTYQDRTVIIRINRKNRKLYTMEDLKESIVFVCEEAGEETEYPAGREEALARHIVMVDKDLSLKDQYDILQGKRQTKKVQVSIRCKSNKEEITKIIKKYSEKFDKAPKNATINRDLSIVKEKDGWMIDTTKIAKELTEYLDSTEKKDFSKNYQTTPVKATVRASYLKKINTKIGSFSTMFIPTNTRGKNIKIAASRIDGKLLKPKERISFLDALYDDSDGKSYGKSGGFLNNRVVQVEGGGICQVSTTAYVAFLMSGIIPVERHPHTCKVSYAKSGLDAALAVGTKDLVVENTLECPILIRAEVNGGTLQVMVYSYKDAKNGYSYKARTVSEEGSMTVESFLDVYRGGEKVETKALSVDTYKKLRG